MKKVPEFLAVYQAMLTIIAKINFLPDTELVKLSQRLTETISCSSLGIHDRRQLSHIQTLVVSEQLGRKEEEPRP